MSENNSRGNRFEYVVEKKLRENFNDVKKHVKIIGYSGTYWRVDFLVDEKLIVESSLQKRMETKISSVFMKFVDINKAHPEYKCGLVVSHFYTQRTGRNNRRKYASTQILVMAKHNYPIIVADDTPKLSAFLKNELTALHILQVPFDITKIEREKNRAKNIDLVMQALSLEPMSAAGLSRHIGIPWTTVRLLTLPHLLKDGRVIRAGNYYVVNNDDLMMNLLSKPRGEACRKLVDRWLESKVMDYFKTSYVLKTSKLAKKLGISSIALGSLLGKMCTKGIVKPINKGEKRVWVLANPNRQEILDIVINKG